MKNKFLITLIATIITCLSMASIANQPQINHTESSTVENLPSDSTITTTIKTKFFNDDVLSGFDLHVKTINGEVTLSGNVVDNTSKDRAISITKNTNGVKNVVSSIVVQHP